MLQRSMASTRGGLLLAAFLVANCGGDVTGGGAGTGPGCAKKIPRTVRVRTCVEYTSPEDYAAAEKDCRSEGTVTSNGNPVYETTWVNTCPRDGRAVGCKGTLPSGSDVFEVIIWSYDALSVQCGDEMIKVSP